MVLGTLIKQPNGKYCIVDYTGKIKCYNLNEQNIVDMYIKDAIDNIRDAEHYSNIIKRTVRSGYEETLNVIPNDILKEMGFDETYKELLKYVPRNPTNTSYCNHDCTTYGKCPNCGKEVENGMGGIDKQCKSCGQILKW